MSQPHGTWHEPPPDVPVNVPAVRSQEDGDLRLHGEPTPGSLAARALSLLPPLSVPSRGTLVTLALAVALLAAVGSLGNAVGYASGVSSMAGIVAAATPTASASASPAPPSLTASVSATTTRGVSASLTSSLTPPASPAATRPPLPSPSNGAAAIAADAAAHMVAGGVAFVAIGDWGQCADNGDPIGRSSALNCVRQRSLVASMEAWAVASGSVAVISLGDNMYDGVSDDTDARFTYSWREVYNTPRLRALPWLLIQGNHDYVLSLQAQLNWGGRPHADSGGEPWDARWTAPDLNFTLQLRYGSAPGACVALVLFDTSPLMDLYRSGNLGAGPTRSPNTNLWNKFTENIRASQPTAQLAWLREQLLNASRSCDAVVVAGHHQVYSSGTHGRAAREQDLRDRLAMPSVFSFLGVDAYLGGHDHFLEALESGGVQYIVSGAGADLRSNNYPRSPQSKFLWDASNGFTVHSANATHMSHIFVGANGAVLYAVVAPLAPKLRTSPAGRGPRPAVSWFVGGG